MQGALARVCMVVAAAILNHPLLFPQENSTLPEQDEELIARMREHEERLEMEQARLEKELSQLESEQEETSSEDGYRWYFWSAFSLVIFFTIEVCRVDLADIYSRQDEDEDMFSESGSISPRTLVLDKDILSNFCDRCIYTSTHENWRVREFVEGFADDLLEALRSVCDRDADMEVGDFVGVGSMFESWKVNKPLMCDLIVPFSPPEPYSFQFQLWCSPSSDMPLDMQGCGTITVARFGETEENCLCGSANLGEDMLCLLHCKNDRLRVDLSPDELLCSKNTPYLAKDQVMKWFQISVTKAWGRISHKYEFEVTFRNLDAAGALKIRFRTGKVIVLNIIPVVQLGDTDAYFVSHFPSDCDSCPDPCWPLSFAVYERNLLKHVAKSLPDKSCHLHCLQIITFLHKKQTGLTGQSGLTNYHLKTALLHLLISKSPSSWGIESMEHRLRDVFGFLQRSLQEKRLYHVLIGNSQVPEEIKLPEIFCMSEPINLFRPLVLQRELHADTVRHFQEMSKNAPVLIQEYTPLLLNGSIHHRLDERL
ncbi:inositol 1,4,5-trisphosphate receptor-interacting protein [Myripristis murdjan]|uniref:Inositol 1,4,5-trisphosphate receptor-interacting protein n=1 Tax=Myripristis murdjan TaxID=586833 RepID=A0A667YNL4_9TELE|nr:inositol 1,4,5-trisphosphate receptor-interacting protein [Myripristis murdjan]XP_029926655.1 inositol 1,4,5-trisphosphate receptor-interacting protein [Myripristis murdjan]XP_029926656.1 inositol 1,4,5-trisphosphate receptor-interacting protein [Myripristis murdjan]